MILQPEQKLKQIRELKNLSQEYIANQLGLSVRAYSKIETGETQLTINRLNEISRIMGVDPIEVLGFDDKTKEEEEEMRQAEDHALIML